MKITLTEETIINFLVGLIALFLYAALARVGRPPTALLLRTPLWMITGGLIGATYVVGSVVLAPRLGAAVRCGDHQSRKR